MPNVGYATIQIIPSVRGISDELRRQLVGPAGDAGGDAGQAAGSGLRDKVKVAAAAAGVAAGALLVAGIREAMEQSQVARTLQAQLGTTNKVASAQGKLAGKLYSSGVSGSFQEAADAIKSVVQAGLAPPGTTTKQLEAIATKASDVANVFGQDLGGVTNAVSQMMRTGLAKNSTQAFDLITKGFQSGADKGGDLLDTINEYGTQFRKAGLDGAEAMGLLTQAIRAGARDSDVAADAIKEFAIRAVDGSTTTAEGFKMLGLNADDMAAKFAKGGTSANAVLDLTLDRLRGIKDPIKQSQAAVQLFGTQSEDLGAALLAMDPSKAAAGLGKFSGAADRAGKTIRSGPGHEIEVFTRTLKQGFVDFVGGQVLPIVSKVAQGFTTYLLPPLRIVGSAVAAVLLPALRGLLSAGASVVGWLQGMGAWLVPVGIAVAGLTAAIFAQQIATAAVAAVFAVYRGAILAWTAVQRGATIAQAAFNAVMNANPVMLVITAIVALGAALVLAYQRSETFRNIVQAAWTGIQTAAMFVWNSVLKPALAGIMAGLRAVGTVALWLWQNAIQPVFSFISTAARILLTVLTVVVFGPIYLAVRALGAVFKWLWNNAISPVVGWITAGLKVLWDGVKVVFGLFRDGLHALGKVFKWLWNNAVSPVFNWIATGARTVWDGVKVIFGLFRDGLHALGKVFKWLWNNGVKPAMDGIRSVISTVWNSGIKPVFERLGDATRAVSKAFDTARRGIKTAWDKVKSIAKAPVSFIVNTVYNKGIVGVWNAVAGAFGAPKLKKFSFASGGVLPGYTPGRDPHKFYSPSGMQLEMSGGEAIMRPEFTRAVGGGFIGTMNRIAKSRGTGGVKEALAPLLGGNPRTPVDRSLRYANGGTVQRFADGGIFSWIGKGASALAGAGSAAWNGIKKGAKWLGDTLEASARAGVKHVVDPLLRSFPGMDSGIGKMIRRIPTKMIDALFGYSKQADKKGAGGLGGPRIQRALNWAKSQHGKAYQWGGNGNPSWDCSGFMSAIESVIRGQKPHRRWSTHAFKGGTPPGWVRNGASPFRVGITHAGVGHTAGTLGKTAVESRGGDGVVVGSRARGYNSKLFTSWYGFRPGKYDSGGWLQPGLSAVVNQTGQPEAVLTAGQWQVMSAAAQGGMRDLQVQVFVGDREITDIARAEVRASNSELLRVINAS